MIEREKYSKEIDEIINTLAELKIKNDNSQISEINLVTCLGGLSLQLEDLAKDLENEINNPT